MIDFGIALAPHLRGLTATGIIMGTPEYMAPAQIRGEEADPSTDLYALGVILYEMVTGAPPSCADTPIAVGFAHLNREPVPPSQARPGVAPEWDRVVLLALAKRRSDRYRTAADILRDIEGLA